MAINAVPAGGRRRDARSLEAGRHRPLPGRRHSRCGGDGLRRVREQGETGRTASRHLRGLGAVAVSQRLEQQADLGTETTRRCKKIIAVLDNLPRRPSVRGNDVLRKTVPATGAGQGQKATGP